ncbi:hypothetical protein [Pseudarthrobacter sp. C1]|uniref:hypothetical protein n=1 Tax=Pseudarthrobacter sp. C1 TaxID=3108940 RepID=UPI002B056CB5|nr:hypothetical protein [Pseudarthrobacter sp. C1]MEA3552052.1 hypothetical protein [Pseudarthrobacter sp. C1]
MPSLAAVPPDERLDKLHEVAQWSFRDSACEAPPVARSGKGRLDWQLFVPTAAYLVDVVGFSRKWLLDVRADQ